VVVSHAAGAKRGGVRLGRGDIDHCFTLVSARLVREVIPIDVPREFQAREALGLLPFMVTPLTLRRHCRKCSTPCHSRESIAIGYRLWGATRNWGNRFSGSRICVPIVYRLPGPVEGL